jgi:hypothetical protein
MKLAYLRILFSFVFLAIALQTKHAEAQYYRRGGGYGGGASTAAEAYAFGVSSMIRSQGEYNLMTSQAMINSEQAAKMDSENRVLATKNYFEMRRINQEYHNSLRSHHSAADFARYAADGAPKRLTPTQLDPVSGRINWTPILQDDAYADYRQKLEILFAERASHHSDLGGKALMDVRQTAGAMEAELKKHLSEMTSQDFEDSKKLIDGLLYETHFPAG